jgi:RNA polymerase sigma factor (sigma-70 family)
VPKGREEELAALVVAAQAGDLDAFSKIVGRFQAMAYATADSHLGDHHLAEDAAQEAFVEAFVNLVKLKDPAAFPGWFRQILLRQSIRRRRRGRVSTVPLDAVLEMASQEPGPAEVAENGALKEQVLAALSSLPEHERRVTQLFYMDGCSYQQIAEWLGLPLTTVKKRLHSARNRLKARMEFSPEQKKDEPGAAPPAKSRRRE